MKKVYIRKQRNEGQVRTIALVKTASARETVLFAIFASLSFALFSSFILRVL